jgi:hypothetical protein
VNPGGGVDQDHGILAFATLLQKLLNAHQVLARSRVLCELGHALSAVEFLDGSDDCFTLRLCFGESNSVLKVVIGNINCCLHDSILSVSIFQVNHSWNTGPCGVTARMRRRKHDPDYLKGSMDNYFHDSVGKGWVSVWWAYREAHEANLAVVAKAYQNRPLPVFESAAHPKSTTP